MKQKKCKICPTIIEKPKPFQEVCSYQCSIELLKRKKQRKKLKKWRKEKREKLPDLYPRKYRKYLQDEINKLSRMIDSKLGHNTCIDCGETLIGIKQVDAAHFHNTAQHGNIRYNLHNIHSARSNCNFYSDTHKEGYKVGLEKRYGKAYLEKVQNLDKEFKDVKLTNKETAEKLKIVRKLIRDFDTYVISDGIEARELFNKIIGIYK